MGKLSESGKLIRPIVWPVIAACRSSSKEWGTPTKQHLGDLFRAAREVFTEATQCANFVATQLAALDGADFILSRRNKTPTPIPDTKPIYATARKAFSTLDCMTVSSIVRHVLGRYRANRMAVLCRGQRSLETYRYPQTITLKAEESPFEILEGTRPVVKLPFAVGSKRSWWTLELSTGRGMEQHLELLREVLEGKRERGSISFWLGSRGDLMVSLPVARDVDRSKQEPTRALLIRTDAEHLLVLECQGFYGRQIPTFHEDWIRRKISMHTHWRKQMAEDLKTVRRGGKCPVPTPSGQRSAKKKRADTRKAMREALERRCDRQHARIMDRLHKVARCVADYAKRQRVAVAIGDFTCTSWVEPFPWHTLKRLLADKFDEYGIQHTNLRTETEASPAPPTPPDGGATKGYTWQEPNEPGECLESATERASMETAENVARLIRRATGKQTPQDPPGCPDARGKRRTAKSPARSSCSK